MIQLNLSDKDAKSLVNLLSAAADFYPQHAVMTRDQDTGRNQENGKEITKLNKRQTTINNQFFEVAVRYDKTMENGAVKRVTEPYIVDALSFTEAEARTTEYMQPYISGDFRVVKEKITNISEVVPYDDPAADRWYKVKHNIITVNEKTGVEKATPQYLLFQASSNDDARDRYVAYVKDWMADVELDTVAETKYMDYIRYNSNGQ